MLKSFASRWNKFRRATSCFASGESLIIVSTKMLLLLCSLFWQLEIIFKRWAKPKIIDLLFRLLKKNQLLFLWIKSLQFFTCEYEIGNEKVKQKLVILTNKIKNLSNQQEVKKVHRELYANIESAFKSSQPALGIAKCFVDHHASLVFYGELSSKMGAAMEELEKVCRENQEVADVVKVSWAGHSGVTSMIIDISYGMVMVVMKMTMTRMKATTMMFIVMGWW